MDSVGKRGKRGKRGIGGNRPRFLITAAIGGLAFLAAACGSSSTSTSSGPTTVRLGYFPNITHAPALVGVQQGIFAKDLGTDKLDASKTFNAGPAETEAMLSGAIDIGFIGPGPSVTAFSQSNGAVQIISGTTSGGAALVTKTSITSVDQLRGKSLATPQLANTQDVALRYFLKTKGFTTDPQGGGDVHIKPQANSQTVQTFKQGTIDGAWVPEPFVSQLVAAGGHVLVNEKDLWPDGRWDTTNVLVRTAFLKAHPTTVRNFLTGLYDTIQYMRANPAPAQAAANQQIQSLTGKALPAKVLSASFSDLVFTTDPIASSVIAQAAHAKAVGLLAAPKINGIFNLTILNQVLKAKGQAEVSGS